MGFLLVTLTAGAATPSYAPSAKPDFAAQAKAAGLTGPEAASLQKRVDDYLARIGGTQVTINKINLDGKAELLLTLPGEERAREVDENGGVGTAAACDYYSFCAYSQQNQLGNVLSYTYCAYQLEMPFYGYGSYINHQSWYVSAHFYDYNRVYMYDSLQAPVIVNTFNWSYVSWIKPCGAI
jgi:hypothetical protein